MKKVPLLENLPFYQIISRTNGNVVTRIFIAAITEEQEIDLDNEKEITLEFDDVVFNISPNKVECYGIIDFHNNSEDMDTIANFDWLNHLGFCGKWIPSNYDYEHHCAYSDINVPRMYDTVRPEVLAQYAHGLIGKPERCVIFKYQTNKRKYDKY